MKTFFLFCAGCFFSYNIVFAQAVGIGTVSPHASAQLDVVSTTKGFLFPRMTSAQRNAIVAPAAGLTVYETTTGTIWVFDGSTWNQLASGVPQSSLWQASATRNFVYNTTDSIGIGTALPTERLNVKGNMKIEATSNVTGALLRMYGGTSTNSFIGFYKDITAPVLGASFGYSPVSDYLYLSNGTGVYLKAEGLGISTALPLAKLHIVNGQDAGLGSTTNGYMMLGSETSTNLIFDNNEMMARNNGVAAPLVLQNDGGSVRIGNVATPTGYLFSVKGKMIAEELKVQLNGSWPDYVFDNQYSLKALPDLEAYIQQHKHLPNIPPASELENNGLEVGDMQRRMMEKIEELTLYVIDLQKQIDLLKRK